MPRKKMASRVHSLRVMKRTLNTLFVMSQLFAITAINALARPIKLPPPPPTTDLTALFTMLQAVSAVIFR